MVDTPEDALSVGVPEPSVATTLQRGGEELLLEKTSDRFTIRPTSSNLPDLPATNAERIPNTGLQEITVPPKQRDAAMQMARDSESVAFASHVYQLQNNPQTSIYLTDQLTIQFAPEAIEAQINEIASEFSLQLLRPIPEIPNAYVFQLTPEATENPVKIANHLTGRSLILVAEPNIIIKQEQHYRPSDRLYPQQWYLQNNGGSELTPSSHIDVEKAWDITRGNRAIVVAVADDGVDLNHPDFQGTGKIVAPKDFSDRDFIPQPGGKEPSHGTACAGVAVAEENGSGIVGVAPGCALMPIRTSGYLDDDTIEQLFDWAIKNNASVISCSWGAAAIYFPLSLRQSAALTRTATKGRAGKGCVIVFAAGNANRPVSGTLYEQGWENNLLKGSTKWLSGYTIHPDVIAVSASTSLSKKSAYSNWGTNISVCAPSNNAPPGAWFEQTGYTYTAPEVTAALPGLGILTTDELGAAGYETGDFVGSFGGTSSACPVVAGVAALVLSANPNLTAQEVKRILQDSADKIVDRDADPQLGLKLGTYDATGYSQWFGYGKVNALKAVQAAQSQTVSQPAQRTIGGRNDTAIAIPDDNLQGVTTGIQISESSPVKDIQVAVDIEHSFLGDITLSLKAPNGQTALLQSRVLGSQTKLQATYSSVNTPTLKSLLNLPSAGVWQLQAIDYAPMDTGRIRSWELTLSV